MKRHCSTCMSERPEDLNTGADPDLQGYSACCNDRVCDGGEYDVRLLPDGQEFMGTFSAPPGSHEIRTCCVNRAREFLGMTRFGRPLS